MNARFCSRASLPAIAASAILFLATSAFGAAIIDIQNNDAAGVGFNDATVVAPVGGNTGTTLGQQRLNAFQAAANIWGATLTSTTTITIRAQWTALSCTANDAVLGSAGTINIFRDFLGAPFAGTWYGGALANKLAGSDLDANPEINANFNVNLGNANCLTGVHFYLGLDNNHVNDVDLVSVLLHEFAHGLGFQTFTTASTGARNSNFPSIYDRFLFDDTTGKTWSDASMTDAERATSALNTRKLSWNGLQVTSAVPGVLAAGTPLLRVNSPAAIAGVYNVGTAAFGPPLSSPGTTGNVVPALDPADGSGPTTFDGCSAFTNAAAVSGNIALIDRGTCTFVTKVTNAQNAGALGVIIVNNVSGSPPPGMGGTTGPIIPSVMVTQDDGASIRNQIAGLAAVVNATLTLDPAVRSGADPAGRALLYTPNPFESGSSVSHWDTIAFPNQLMEPSSNSDVTHSVTPPQDLTFSLLRDVGWVTASAANIQFSAASYSAGEGDVSVVITVNRTGDTAGASTVDFSLSDGTARQKSDYEINNGTLTFAAGATSTTFKVLIVDDAFDDDNETVNLALSNPTGAILTSPNAATITIIDNDSTTLTSPVAKQFVANLTGAAEVPPNASTATGGAILQLNANDTSLLFSLIFSGLSFPELIARVHGPSGPTTNAPVVYSQPTLPQIPNGSPVTDFTISPTAQEVADLKAGLHHMNVHVSGAGFPSGEIRGQFQWNPMEEADSFVRQAYFDFLSRSPDAGGLAFWTGKIAVCQSDVQCLRNARIDVSNQFYAELEFQQTGAYVYRLYRAAYGNNQPFPNTNPDPMFPNEEKTMPSYPVFVADRTRVTGSANLAQSQLDLATAFVQRAEFSAKYPTASLNTGTLFVDAVLATLQTFGVDLTAQKPTLVGHFNSGGRALVMFHLANDYWNKCPGAAPCQPAGFGAAVDNRPLIDAEYNRAFVLTEYWGYLRRNPDLPGFRFWLDRVNGAPLRDLSQQRRMVCVFSTSAEFQNRFGLVASRNNSECQ